MNIIRICFLLLFLYGHSLAVTVIPASFHLPKPYREPSKAVSSEYRLLIESIPALAPYSTERPIEIQGLFGSLDRFDRSSIYPLQDSFIRGAIDAWAQHQHFLIRPDDVWFTILMQLNVYLRGHRDSVEVRDKIEYRNYFDFSSINWIDVGAISDRVVGTEMKYRIKANYSMYSFLQPNFTTSTVDDRTTASLITMGVTNITNEAQSVSLSDGGMPSVTLLGVENDWQRLLHKLDYMSEFGDEPANYGQILRPILSRFVKTFANPDSLEIRQFWDDMVRSSAREHSETKVTGWVSGFQYWNASGTLISRSSEEGSTPSSLDGVIYPWRNIHDIPSIYAGLHFREYRGLDCVINVFELFAGMIGKKIIKGRPADYTTALQRANLTLPAMITEDQHVILRPFSRWIQYYDSRFREPPKPPEEAYEAYVQKICRGRPEGNLPSHN
jgi:hypothetical protein